MRDDTLLEKHSDGLEGVSKLWDTKIGAYVLALNIVRLSWSDGKTKIPSAFVIQTTTEEKGSKIDSAITLLEYAKTLKLKARYVLFDSWYAAEKLLKTVRKLGWHFVTRVKRNRNLGGRQVKRYYRHPYWQALDNLEGNVKVKLFRRGSKYFITSNLTLAWKAVKKLYRIRADIEEVIKVLKQECGWQSCQQRSLHTYSQHLRLGMFAYLLLLRLAKRHKTGVYVLPRRLIVGKLPFTNADGQAFLSLRNLSINPAVPHAPAILNQWRDLKLDFEDAKALQREMMTLLERYRAKSGSRMYLVHIGLAPTTSRG